MDSVSPEQLHRELNALAVRAREGKKASRILLETLDEAVRLAGEEATESPATRDIGGLERRQGLRIPPTAEVTLHYRDEALAAKVLDLGAAGFGVSLSKEIPAGVTLRLEAANAEGVDTYSCYVAFTRAKGDHFRLGLKVLALLARA